jgi:hypothetical protein
MHPDVCACVRTCRLLAHRVVLGEAHRISSKGLPIARRGHPREGITRHARERPTAAFDTCALLSGTGSAGIFFFRTHEVTLCPPEGSPQEGIGDHVRVDHGSAMDSRKLKTG